MNGRARCGAEDDGGKPQKQGRSTIHILPADSSLTDCQPAAWAGRAQSCPLGRMRVIRSMSGVRNLVLPVFGAKELAFFRKLDGAIVRTRGISPDYARNKNFIRACIIRRYRIAENNAVVT